MSTAMKEKQQSPKPAKRKNSNLPSCFPFVVIANQCAHWCGNLKNPLRYSRFPRQFANWLGMTIGLCVVFNSSINRNLKSSNVTERVREVTIINALCTYCQRRLAALTNRDLKLDIG